MVVAPPVENDLRASALVFVALMLTPAVAVAELHALIVEGLPGEDVYEAGFDGQVAAIQSALQSVTGSERIHVLRTADASREAILERVGELAPLLSGDDQLAVFLIGHGSYDDYDYKFNIAGPDLTGTDLASSLDEIGAASVLVVNTSSSSGATKDLLAAENRTLVLATRNGSERHATRFGEYFAAALSDASADIDKNERVTVREAFDFAERRVDDYFEQNGQLATEHPVLEGDRSERLSLARLGGARPAVVDTVLAGLIAERDSLAAEVEALRVARDDMDATEYQSQLLEKMLELARVEDAIELRERELGSND